MNDKIVPFEFEHRQVRVIDQAGEPWFFAKDVCDALGYVNSRDAIARHCKASDTVVIRDGIPGNPNVTIIPERDVYRLIMRSNLPAAEAFEELVVGTILPPIRKTGRYEAPISDKIRRETEDWYRAKVVGDRALSVMYGKAAGYDQLLNAQGAITVRTAAKLLGIKHVYKCLQEERIIHRSHGAWLPVTVHLNAGRFRVKLILIYDKETGGARWYPQVLVTAKGIDYLRHKFAPQLPGSQDWQQLQFQFPCEN
jgi:anti-repressor protein